MSNRLGPCKRLRPSLPYTYTPAGGSEYAALEMQPVRCESPQFSDGFAIRFGRYTPPAAVLAVSTLVLTLNGSPVWAVTMPFICQLPNIPRRSGFAAGKIGIS